MNSPSNATTAGNAPARAGALTKSAAWQALTAHHAKVGASHLREFLASDATRGESLVLEAAGLYLDYSKNRITDEILRLFSALAGEGSVRESPKTLVALYERSVVEGVVWDIDSFDQWGVQLGEVQRTIPELESRAEPTLAHDSSTNALIRRNRRVRVEPAVK